MLLRCKFCIDISDPSQHGGSSGLAALAEVRVTPWFKTTSWRLHAYVFRRPIAYGSDSPLLNALRTTNGSEIEYPQKSRAASAMHCFPRFRL